MTFKMPMNKNFLVPFVCFALAGLACQTSVLGIPVAISTPTSIPVASQIAPVLSPTPSRAPVSAQQETTMHVICFQGANGQLRVRECPGLSCREVGVLTGGDFVAVTGEQKVVDGSAWLKIESPVDGWVNARYVCSHGSAGK